jgi:dephospho-CoA kinase
MGRGFLLRFEKMDIGLSLVVCGKICSGKSSAIKFLIEKYPLSKVSFGDLVRRKASELGLEPTRESHQRLGYELFTNSGAKILLNEALDNLKSSASKYVVFDGVRHVSILTEIEAISRSTIVIYLEAEENIRFKRYQSKSPETKISVDDFRNIDNHPIEQGIQGLSRQADIIIDSSEPFELVCQRITDLLRTRKLNSL